MLRVGLLLTISVILTACGIGGTASKTQTPLIRPEATEVKWPRVKHTELIMKEGMQVDRGIEQVGGVVPLGQNNDW